MSNKSISTSSEPSPKWAHRSLRNNNDTPEGMSPGCTEADGEP